jgi:hypothetical protein
MSAITRAAAWIVITAIVSWAAWLVATPNDEDGMRRPVGIAVLLIVSGSDRVTGEVHAKLDHVAVFPATEYVTDRPTIERALAVQGSCRRRTGCGSAHENQIGDLLGEIRRRWRGFSTDSLLFPHPVVARNALQTSVRVSS